MTYKEALQLKPGDLIIPLANYTDQFVKGQVYEVTGLTKINTEGLWVDLIDDRGDQNGLHHIVVKLMPKGELTNVLYK